MAKRYTDTEIYKREWFQQLPLKFKAFWDYLYRACDHAGIYQVNIPLAGFLIGADYTREEILSTFNGRIVEIEEDKWWIPKFIYWQYGVKDPLDLNENVNVQRSVIKQLEKYGIYGVDISDFKGSASVKEGLPNTSARVKAKDKAKVKDKAIKKKDVDKKLIAPTLKEVINYFEEKKYDNANINAKTFWNYYESIGWVRGKSKIKKWRAAAAGWMNRQEDNKINKRTYIQEGHKGGIKDKKW